MTRVYICALLLLPSVAAALDLDDSTFTDRKVGIRMEVPEGWVLHRHTGYPSLLALMLQPQRRSSITLAVGPEGSARDLRRFVQRNIDAVRKVGLRVTEHRVATVGSRSVWRLSMFRPGHDTAVRQIYLGHGGVAVILTLSTPKKQLAQTQFDLTATAELLELAPPSGGPPQPRAASSYPRRSPGTDPQPPGQEGPETSSRPNPPEGQPPAPGARPAQRPVPAQSQPATGPHDPGSQPASRPASPRSQPATGPHSPSSQPATGPRSPSSRPASRPAGPPKLQELEIEGFEP